MQKRASDKSVVKNKYWDGAREEEAEETDVLKYKQQKEQGDEKDSDDEVMEEKKDVKKKSDKETNEQLQIHEIPYKSNSVGAAVIFAVLIRPCVHNTPKTVRRTLSTLRLRRVQEGVFLRYTPSMRKMLHLVEPYVLYGIPSVETISDLVHRRGYCRVEGKRVQISDNNVIEQQLGNVGLICVEDLIQVLSSGEGGQEENLFQAVSKFLWPFRLSSRKSKFQKRMLDLKDVTTMSTTTTTATETKPKPTIGEILDKAAKSAMRGGTAGAVAMGLNVGALMWMRTTVNYQYRNGTSFPVALRTLYADGGIPRFYRGLLPALIQGPLSRFGDTAANTGMLTLLDSFETTQNMNVAYKTAGASVAAATFRIFLMPVDTVKTTMQVTGKFSNVVNKVKAEGVTALYHGSLAAASATFVGHYPWFFTYNLLSEKIPKQDDPLKELGRRAILGFCSSAVSDTCSNSIRVVKVYKQSSEVALSYPQVVKNVIQESGVWGLMFRGLETKILANGLQGILFSVMWKHFEEVLFPKK
eukprot:CCRYP_004539-RA/>CCRYP_004539-RA protein AED:0.21 eAED:0.21 QI:0/0.85/0.75/1/0.57/0.37/8/1655/526